MMTEITLHDFEKIVFFTGAGMSAESGIPTYRGQGGTWHQYNWEEYACQRAFDSDPQKVWEFHDKRREAIAACKPNSGHRIIAEIERDKPETTIITQNIDGMHQRAGSKNVIELHGSIWRVRCDMEGKIFDNSDVPIKSYTCSCGEFLRPDIVWFEDPLREESIQQAIVALLSCDVLVSIGTSAAVYPAAQLPMYAMQRGILSIEINIEKTPVTEIYQLHLQGTASEMLRKLWSKS